MSTGMFEIGDVVGGRFTIESFLGAGAFGAVYRALSAQFGEVALKLLRAEADGSTTEKLRSEAMILAQLQHANIVKIYEVGRHKTSSKDRAYLAMEYVAGGTLEDYLGRNIKIAMDEALAAGAQILSALCCAHNQEPPVVHGDLKPSNILLVAESPLSLKIGDFGLATAVSSITGTTAAAGTLFYMAPESLWGFSLPASDVFSAGMILYQLLTGVSPFPLPENIETDGKSDFRRSIERSRREAPAPPSQFEPTVSGELDAVILKSLSLDYRDRYRDAIEFLDAISRPGPQLEPMEVNETNDDSRDMNFIPVYQDTDYLELACKSDLTQDESQVLYELYCDIETPVAVDQMGAFSILTLTGLTRTELATFTGRPLGALLADNRPLIADLRVLKDIGKLLYSNPYSVRARRAGMLLYGCAIAKALDAYGERISGLSYPQMRQLWGDLLGWPCLPLKYRLLLRRGSKFLESSSL